MNPRPAHFLLIEDDDDHAELISMELRQNKGASSFDRVADGEAGLAYLRREGEFADRPRPDVILLDLNLPKIGGHQVLESIKRDDELRSIPVVVLTTSAAEADKARAYANHANSYLVKPVDYRKFHEMIRDLKLYWAAWNELPSAA